MPQGDLDEKTENEKTNHRGETTERQKCQFLWPNSDTPAHSHVEGKSKLNISERPFSLTVTKSFKLRKL